MIAGTRFNSFSTFMFWVMEPSEYDTLLTTLDASFNLTDTTVLPIASVLLVLGIVAALAMAPTLDVLTLGRNRATVLDVAYRRSVTRPLIIMAGLVAVSTALVGPVLLRGLLVANLAYLSTRTQQYSITLPAAILISLAALARGHRARARSGAAPTPVQLRRHDMPFNVHQLGDKLVATYFR